LPICSLFNISLKPRLTVKLRGKNYTSIPLIFDQIFIAETAMYKNSNCVANDDIKKPLAQKSM
jgi:hypothetical protein